MLELSPPTVGTPDARSFPAATRRARILRTAFAGAALLLVVAAAAHARGLDASKPGLVPSGTTGVAVIDLSLSITDEDYRSVRNAFRRLIDQNASIGLVVFSDVAYELLPPGTPASELRPMLRLLVPPRLGPPINPWVDTFRSGTRVSVALELARTMLERERVRSGSILLVSDLETAPDDVPALTRTVERLRRGSTELRVIGLSPSTDARLIFGGLLQEGAFGGSVAGAREPGDGGEARAPLPTTLLVLAAMALLALALHERFGGRLAITGGARSVS
ncbi:MAG: VWA domain-containing protein [Actinobacteria bacterium]|nr:VWA domain-containing protein [Actinomycetota bacterium]